MAEQTAFVLERTFDAPRDLVWKAWTEPDLLQKWHVHDLKHINHAVDVSPGGLWLLEIEHDVPAPNYRHRFEFTEVAEPKRLTCISSVADADWNPISPPLIEGFPHLTRRTVTLEEEGQKTICRFVEAPLEANELETTRFAEVYSKGQPAWNICMEKLAETLECIQA